MKIIYTENPLYIKVFLTDAEKRLLFWNYAYSRADDSIWMLRSDLEPIVDGEGYNMEKVKKHYNRDYLERLVINPLRTVYDSLKNISDNMTVLEYKESTITDFIDALQDRHAGDCCRIPSPCLKCWAEDILGIDTLTGCRPIYPLHMAFSNDRSIDQAIEYLEINEHEDKSYSAVKDYLKFYRDTAIGKSIEL